MKMHLVLAAFAAVCSNVAFAASEGGDTWSAVQPQPRSPRPFAITTAAPLSTSPQGFPVPASEGGDTWSVVQSQVTAHSTQSPVVATTAPLSTLQRDYPSYASPYGTPAQPDGADRTVRLSPSLHSVNVAYGETVRFVVDAENGSQRSFAWRFDVSPVLSHVDLSDVAPADLHAANVRVFVAPDSRYRGG